MRFTFKCKKKTTKHLSDNRELLSKLNKDHNSNNLQMKYSFKDCKYAKYVPRAMHMEIDNQCDLLAQYKITNDKKLDRFKRLQAMAKFILTSSYYSRSCSTSKLENLNKKVKSGNKEFKPEKSDTEAIQMRCISREFQRVMKKSLKDPVFQEKNGSAISIEYDDNQNSIRNLKENVKMVDRTVNYCSSNKIYKSLKRKEYESMKFHDTCNDFTDPIKPLSEIVIEDHLNGGMELIADKEEHRDVKLLENEPKTTGAYNLGSEKMQNCAKNTENALEILPMISKNQTVWTENRHDAFDQNHAISTKQKSTEKSKRVTTKLNGCLGRKHNANQEIAGTRLYDQFKATNYYHKGDVRIDSKRVLDSTIAETFGTTAERFYQGTASTIGKVCQNSALMKLPDNSLAKNDNKFSSKKSNKILEIINVRRFGDVNEKHCKATSKLVTHRLNNDSSILSVCVFIQDNLNEPRDLVKMKLEFTNRCLSSYFYPGKNIVSVKFQKDLKKFLYRTVFQKSSSVKDLFGVRHLSSEAFHTKAVIMVSQPISAMLRHRDICLLDTLHVILGTDQETLLILKALGKS